MLKIKGGEDSHAAKAMSKAMGGGAGAGSGGGNQVARNMGMPSAAPSSRAPSAGLVGFYPNDEKAESDDDDDLLDFGDAEDEIMAKLREKRMAELKKQNSRQNEFAHLGHGKYTEVSQDEFLPAVTKSKYVVCHFYHDGFERCKIVDKHLPTLAMKHWATRFVSINAEKSPFFVGKLSIKILPTLVFFKDGVAIDRLVGFGDLGGTDEFPIERLEARIAQSGLLIQEKVVKVERDGAANIRASEHANFDMEDD